jgi:hypothetical protein
MNNNDIIWHICPFNISWITEKEIFNYNHSMKANSQFDFGLLALSALLWIIGLTFFITAAWLVISGAGRIGTISFATSVICTAAGWGVYKRRRWGVVLFCILGLLGSANHLIATIDRYSDLSSAGPSDAIIGLFSILAAMLIPAAITLTSVSLWKRF